MTTHVSPLTWLITTVALLTGSSSVSAQSSDNYARQDSTQAYWTLKADYADQKPTVQFFNTHHELLYQERLSGPSNRMTRQTRRAFDILLANLTTNRVLATTYLPNSTLTESVSTVPVLPAETKAIKQVVFEKGTAVFSVDPTVSQGSKLTISMAQEANRPVSIAIEDDERVVTYYNDFTNLTLYRRTIDLEQMPGGTYSVRISSAKRIFAYWLTIDRIMNRYWLRPQPGF